VRYKYQGPNFARKSYLSNPVPVDSRVPTDDDNIIVYGTITDIMVP
jgi:hypothetical protein